MSTSVPEPAYFVGIDLGTSNCAAAFAEISGEAKKPIHDFPITQVEKPGASNKFLLFPSALYVPPPEEASTGLLDLPWPNHGYVAGAYARSRGARVPGRLITSAKSWLCHPGVDRSAPILPWGALPEIPKISPVKASALLLEHIRNAWDSEHPSAPLAHQEVVITVPASFDEAARSLTVQAAKEAGFEHFTLLEEPQAAFYHFTSVHSTRLEAILQSVQLVLVVDVGGGTTDLTLVRVGHSPNGVILKRIAVGDHLILGGDNMDNAVARRLEEKLGKKLSAAQWLQLVQLAREAKETLLGENPPAQSNLSLAAEGSRLLGSTLSTSISHQELSQIVLDGFFPLTSAWDAPKRQARTAIHEMGLPYETEPAISRHIAAFLRKHSTTAFEALGQPDCAQALPRPDAILLNGGVFNSSAISERLVQLLSSWWPERPPIPLLAHDSLDLAVSRGAAHYAQVRRGLGRKIGGGSAHAFYAAVAGKDDSPSAVCLIPRGFEEGESVELKDRVFKLQVGRPVQFPIYTTTADRLEKPGEIIAVTDELEPLPPIQTVLKSSKQRAERIPVYLRGRLTELGTLELWCASLDSNEQWRLEFDVRGAAASDKLVVTESLPPNYAQAKEWLEQVYGSKPKPPPGAAGPKDARQLWAFLERTLGPRDRWSLATLRQLWSDLFPLASKRRRTPEHERVCLQLLGYTLRPGFGHPLDEWRASQTFRLFSESIEFHKEKRIWHEFWILWRRIAGGLNPEQQATLGASLKPHLAIRIPAHPPKNMPRPKGIQPEGFEEMVRAAAALEHLSTEEKIWLGGQVANRLKELRPAGGPWAWSLGRIGSRIPFYGSLHNVVPPAGVEPWIDLLLEMGPSEVEGASFALVQLARITSDRLRDINPLLRERVHQALEQTKAPASWLEMLNNPAPLQQEDQARVFGDTLPIGLQLAHPATRSNTASA